MSFCREFVSEVYGEETHRSLEGKRVLTCDPYGDGQDIVDFVVNSAPAQIDLISQRPN